MPIEVQGGTCDVVQVLEDSCHCGIGLGGVGLGSIAADKPDISTPSLQSPDSTHASEPADVESGGSDAAKGEGGSFRNAYHNAEEKPHPNRQAFGKLAKHRRDAFRFRRDVAPADREDQNARLGTALG